MKTTIYTICDFWKYNGSFYCILYKDNVLYFSEAKEIEVLKRKRYTIWKRIWIWLKLIIKEGEIT